jgi:hypothetical protein
MPNKYSSGKYAIAECDRCGQRYKLKELKKMIIKTKLFNIKVCPECWDPDQPQLSLGLYPVNDPQAVREPRPDVSYNVGGTTGLMTNLYDPNVNNVDDAGYPTDGSRQIQWGWQPVGGASYFDTNLTPNDLLIQVQIGTVTIVTT